jgi:hypothetical protein
MWAHGDCGTDDGGTGGFNGFLTHKENNNSGYDGENRSIKVKMRAEAMVVVVMAVMVVGDLDDGGNGSEG